MNATIEERTFQFSRSVVLFARDLWKNPEGRILAQQLIRSATSVGANVTEGRESSSRKQFAQYLQIALRSARETAFWLRLIAESSSSSETLNRLRQENNEISKILAASILRMKNINQK